MSSWLSTKTYGLLQAARLHACQTHPGSRRALRVDTISQQALDCTVVLHNAVSGELSSSKVVPAQAIVMASNALRQQMPVFVARHELKFWSRVLRSRCL